MKTILLASAFTLVAGAAFAAQAPIFEEDQDGNRIYVYQSAQPAPLAQVVEGRSAFVAHPAPVTNGRTPVIEYDYSAGDSGTKVIHWY